MIKNIIPIVLVWFLFSCVKKQKSQFDLLFDNVFEIVSTNYIRNNEINWVEVEKNVRDSIKVFRNNNDVHNATKYTLDLINDNHGFFLMPNKNWLLSDSVPIPEIEYCVIEKSIGYIKIPGFGANDSLSILFALKIRKALKEIDNSSELKGWIIDLKDDIGGRDYSQPLGLSPLFQDSIIGYEKDNKGNIKTITCTNNHYKTSDGFNVKINFDDTLNNKNKKIAVLINGYTASCGESVALAFKFQEKTKLFGSETMGLTTSLKKVSFSPSGADLFFSSAFMCDENKKAILGSLKPDMECSDEKTIEEAIKWIKNESRTPAGASILLVP